MRGNHRKSRKVRAAIRSIPAHAGKPLLSKVPGPGVVVYPRACGETEGEGKSAAPSAGLSPRMRGNLVRVHLSHFDHGSIPAHAGKPITGPLRIPVPRVYPRACGETQGNSCNAPVRRGLSPRMRGNLPLQRLQDFPNGSIPAHAGKPHPPANTPIPLWVYPRACGETLDARAEKLKIKGLSPRMRGNRFSAID